MLLIIFHKIYSHADAIYCHHREVVLLVLLCVAVAQGIIQPWCRASVHTSQTDKTKKNVKKGTEKSGSAHAIPLEDIKKALQVRHHAFSSHQPWI